MEDGFLGFLLGVFFTVLIGSVIWDENTFSHSTIVGNGGAYYDSEGEIHLIDHTKKEKAE